MKVCLAAPYCRPYLYDDYFDCKFMLESFYYWEEWELPIAKSRELFLLDSGAFTFMNNQKKEVDFEKYLDDYIAFINKNDFQYFFELDVDVVLGLKEVERFREKLEGETGKKCIPVWHKSRGKEYFLKMCRDYNFIAIGGIVSKEIKPPEYKYFPWFIKTAHDHGCRIHGLGFTNSRDLPKYHFDSVDSTNWVSGGRYGALYRFNGRTMELVNTTNRRQKENITYKELDAWNFHEWLKFQKFAEKHL